METVFATLFLLETGDRRLPADKTAIHNFSGNAISANHAPFVPLSSPIFG